MKKLGLVISDGVGFRNFILSDFINEAKKEFDEIIIYSFLPAHVYSLEEPKIKVRELNTIREKFYTWFFRKGKEMNHLKRHSKGNFGMSFNYASNIDKKKNIRGYTTQFWNFIFSIIHTEWLTILLEKLQYLTYQFYPQTNEYNRLLASDKPDIIFITHQRPPYIAPFIKAAKQHKIKTSVFIFSWDNLASKGRMAGSFDFYFVWSKLMAEELKHYYPNINSKDIFIAGTPQFEPYVLDRYVISKEEFLKRHHLNPEIKTINFSCGDISTSKNDELYIQTIADAIREGKFGEPLNFIVRTSPAESHERFNKLIEKYPEISWNYPEWILTRENHPETWSQRVPSGNDMTTLRSLLLYCDVNINMCSTMSLDFMHYDKPVINPVFGNSQNGLFDDQKFLDFAHYDRVAKSGSVAIVKNENELISAVKEALKNPNKKSLERKAMIELQTGGELTGTSKRFINYLSKIATSKS